MKHNFSKGEKTIMCVLLIGVLLSVLFFKTFKKDVENFDSNKNYLEGIDVIYWINLDRSHERRQSMESLFSDAAFNDIASIQRFPAIDGKTVDVFSYFEPSEKENPKLNNVEYACLVSHLEVLKEFSHSSNELALIMEDDMTLEFQQHWTKTVKEITEEAPSDWEVIQLCYNNQEGDIELLYNSYRPCCAAYVVNKKSALKLINFLTENGVYNLKKHVNAPYMHADHFIFTYFKTYCYKYPMFIYGNDNDSLLHSDDLPGHIKSKQKIVEMYKTRERVPN